MKCKYCEKNEAVKYSKYSNGEFCSRKCARGYSTKAKRKEINEKVSKALIGTGTKNRYCKYCKIILNVEVEGKLSCKSCKPYVKNKKLFEKLEIKESNLFKANKIAIDKLVDLYYSKKKSLLDIYDEYNIKENTVHWFFKKNNIPLRTVSQGMSLAHYRGKTILPSNNSYKNGWYKTWFGNDVFLRSSYEFRYADFLDRQRVYYEVESKRFTYYLNNKKHTYISDFYIPDWNMIVETKNEYLIGRDKASLKMKQKSVLDAGYEFLLISDLVFLD